jgi:hypothetical protein
MGFQDLPVLASGWLRHRFAGFVEDDTSAESD